MINISNDLITKGTKKTKGFLSEFKTFVSQGNILDLAVGVVIGTAFRAIISSLVADIIMPAIGVLVGGTDFTDLKYILRDPVILDDGTVASAEVAIRYGMLLKNIIDFIIIAFCMFIVVKVAMGFRKKLEALKKKEEEAAPTPAAPSRDEKMLETLTEIRDILNKNSGR